MKNIINVVGRAVAIITENAKVFQAWSDTSKTCASRFRMLQNTVDFMMLFGKIEVYENEVCFNGESGIIRAVPSEDSLEGVASKALIQAREEIIEELKNSVTVGWKKALSKTQEKAREEMIRIFKDEVVSLAGFVMENGHEATGFAIGYQKVLNFMKHAGYTKRTVDSLLSCVQYDEDRRSIAIL